MHIAASADNTNYKGDTTMPKPKVLIAAADKAFVYALTDAIHTKEQLHVVYCTDSEHEAYAYLQKHRIDILIVELELNEGHGLYLLERMHEQVQQRPLLLAVSALASPVLGCRLQEMEVDYMCRKCEDTSHKLVEMAPRLYAYKRGYERRENARSAHELNEEGELLNLSQIVETELIQMGLRKKFVGFFYIREAVLRLFMMPESEPIRITRDIYPIVAEKYHTTTSGVERAIRSALHAAFYGVGDEKLKSLYPYPFDRKVGRPRNADFLYFVTEQLDTTFQSRR